MSGRRVLRGVAYNSAHQFSMSAEHFANMAADQNVSRVEIDLLTGAFEPESFDIRRNRILVEMCRARLRSVMLHSVPIRLHKAILVAEFDLTGIVGAGLPEARFTVMLTDDRGKEWGGDRSIKDWWSGPHPSGSGHHFA